MDAAKTPSGDVTVTLTYDEAVVLSDLLARWERDGTQARLAFEDQAEQRVVWDLTAVFEPLIDGVFSKDEYACVVADSRARVRDATDV